MKKLLILSLIFVSCFSLTSCLRVNYPKQTKYMFNVPLPKRKLKKDSQKTLKIYNTSIAPQFSGVNFVYRTSDVKYLKDHYNIFFTSPSRQINAILANYLYDAGLFGYIADANNVDKPDYVLNSKILALYADYRDRRHPKAVIQVRFILFKGNGRKAVLMTNKRYTQSVSLGKKNSENLIKAWDVGLQRILKQFTITLVGIISD